MLFHFNRTCHYTANIFTEKPQKGNSSFEFGYSNQYYNSGYFIKKLMGFLRKFTFKAKSEEGIRWEFSEKKIIPQNNK